MAKPPISVNVLVYRTSIGYCTEKGVFEYTKLILLTPKIIIPVIKAVINSFTEIFNSMSDGSLSFSTKYIIINIAAYIIIGKMNFSTKGRVPVS